MNCSCMPLVLADMVAVARVATVEPADTAAVAEYMGSVERTYLAEHMAEQRAAVASEDLLQPTPEKLPS